MLVDLITSPLGLVLIAMTLGAGLVADYLERH